MEFAAQLKAYQEYVNDVVLSYLPEETGFQKTVLEASCYSVRNGGKRLRPLFMMLSYELIRNVQTGAYAGGGFLSEEDRAVLGPFMAAVEMIHCSSLVHDDLPCMDNDTLRRGVPSTWAKFGEDMGTLAGDALMLYAFETAAKITAKNRRGMEAMSILAGKSGMFGMVGGQTLDVELTGKKPSRKELKYIYENKTGALLELSFMAGAVLAGAKKRQTALLGKAALALGMAFQIRDDILDETASTEELGKPSGSDKESGKITWVTQAGLEKAQADVEKFTGTAIEALHQLSGDDAFLTELFMSLTQRKS